MEHTVEEIELIPGAKGLFIDVPGSRVVNVKVYFRAGFQFGSPGKYETPHLIEHHVFNGTRRYPKNNSIMVELERNGANRNAFTSPDYIGYWFECAEFEVDRMLELLTELVARPTFPAEHYETERGNVRSELQRNATDWGNVAAVRSTAANYPWRSLDYLTRLEQLDSITHDDVVGHYRQTHHARNAVFVVAGAVGENRDKIERGLRGLFEELQPGELKPLRDDIGLGQKAPLVQHEDIKAIYYNASWYAEGGERQELAALRLLRALLTDGFSSRVLGQVRQKGLAYGIGSGFSHSRSSASFAFAGFADPEKLAGIFDVVASECADIVANGVAAAELEEARKRVIGGITVGTQTVSSISSWYIGDYADEGFIESYEEYFELLEALTGADVQAAASKIFKTARHSTSFVGPMDEAKARDHAQRLAPIRTKA